MVMITEFGFGDEPCKVERECYIPIYLIKSYLKGVFKYNGYSTACGDISFNISFNTKSNSRFKSSWMNIIDFFTNYYDNDYFKKQLLSRLSNIGYNDILVTVKNNEFIFKQENPEITKLKQIAKDF